MTPRSLLSAGSVTEIVLVNCSAAYTRSLWLSGTSGSAAIPGACPAQAAWIEASAVAASNVERTRFMSGLLVGVRRRVSAGPGVGLVRRCGPGRRRVAEEEAHRRDLLPLRDDDLLGEPPELF